MPIPYTCPACRKVDDHVSGCPQIPSVILMRKISQQVDSHDPRCPQVRWHDACQCYLIREIEKETVEATMLRLDKAWRSIRAKTKGVPTLGELKSALRSPHD